MGKQKAIAVYTFLAVLALSACSIKLRDGSSSTKKDKSNGSPAPVAEDVTASTDEDNSVVVILSASDKNSKSLSYSIVNAPAHGQLGGNAPLLVYTPDANYFGTDSFSYVANDGNSDSNEATATITINQIDDPPTANAQSVDVDKDTPTSIVLGGSDLDGDSLSYSVVTNPSNGSLSGSAPNLTYTPNASYIGSDSFNFLVNDGTSDSNTATVSIDVLDVNSAPVASNISPASFDEDTESVIALVYSDADGDNATSCSVSGLSNVTESTPCSCDGSGNCSVGVTGFSNYNGAAGFNYTVTANSADSNSASASLTIDAVGDDPVASNISPASFDEDVESVIALVYSDADGDKASSCSVGALSNVTISSACSCDGSGNCSVGVTGASDYNGGASFVYTVTANSVTSNSATASLTIDNVDDAPVASNISPASFDEDTESVISLIYSDADSDLATSCSLSGLTNVSVSSACACALGTCTVGVTGTSDYHGAASFSYTVTANSVASNSATASLTIDNVDDAPVASNISPASFDQDSESVIALVYSDADNDNAASCSVSGLNNVTESTPCSCDGSGNCSVGVTGTASYTGAASFGYTVTANSAVSNSATASLTIDNVDDAPVASNISPASFNEDTESVIALVYSDADSDLATACSVSGLSNVTESTPCSCDGSGDCSVGVTGSSNYNGAASFSYTVTANSVASNSATASLTIDAVDDAPVASNVSPASMSVDTESIIALVYSDEEGDNATSCSVSALTNVTESTPCSCDGSGNCSVGVTGTASYTGAASFTYTVTANSLSSNNASASLSIVGGDSAPVASNISPANIVDGVETFIDLSYTDADGDLATSCAVFSESNATITSACSCPLGACRVGITSDATGAVSFDYYVTANSVDSNTASASLTADAARPSISRVGSSIANNGGGGTTISIAMPAGTVQDDVLLAVLTSRGTGEMSLAGWTELENRGVGDLQQSIFYKVAGASEAGPYVFALGANEKASAVIASYRGVNSSSPILNATSQTASASLNITAPSITIPSGEEGAILFGGYGEDRGTTITLNGDLTLIGSDQSTGAGANSRTTTIAGDMTFNSTGATGHKISTAGDAGDDNIGHLVALARAPLASDYAPIAYDVFPANFDEDTESIITLSYYDPNNDEATSCSITELYEVFVSTACSCSSGECSVGITGETDVNGFVSFNYTLLANGKTSNVANASIVLDAVPDAPLANDFSPPSFDEDTESMITLDYTDPDGDLATVCSVGALSNVSLSTGCSCDGSGVCTAGLTGASDYNGGASFVFTVTANGDVSNSGSASLSIDAVDDAPVTNDFAAPEFLKDTESVITLNYTDLESDVATSCSVSGLNNVTESTPCACSVGTCTVGVTGTASYTGPASFDFTVTANSAASNSSTATLSIVSTLTIPVANNISPAAFDEDAQSIITLNYSDPNADLASSCSLSDLTNITETSGCTCDGSGTCTVGVTGLNEYSGSASFKYTVTANGDTSNIANASLSINYVDDAPVASNITPADMIEDEETVHTLVYSDAESHLASTCAVSSLTNVTESTPCSCDGSGVCTVGITGTSAYTGAASFAYTVTANSETSNSATATLNIISGTIVSWADITGGTAGDGINYDATLSVESPSLASFNGKLYAAWREFGSPSRVHVAVYNGNDGSPSWSFVDTTVGGAPRSSGEGLNHSTSATAQDPKLVVFNSSLYAVWAEGATRNIRIAEYNGNDGSPDWTFRDGDGADGINVNTGNVATTPDAVVYNGELFIAWKESAGAEQIRVKKMNTSYTLTLVDGGGLNYNAARNARSPKMAVLPGSPDKLYIAWHEFDGSFFQARVKVSSNGTSFSAADGGAATGLNHNTGQGAQDMAITAANGEVYLAWLENGANIRVRSYDGSNDASPTWTWRDGGAAGDGIEYGTGTSPVFASAYTHKGDAYINWSEMDGGKFQIRTKSFDGSSWTWHDGGVAASNVNYSTLQDAAYISMATNDSKLYMGWTEDDGTATYQMNVSVGQ